MRGTQEVAGSSPASSIFSGGAPILVGCDDFRSRISYWLDRVSAGEEALVTYRGTPRVLLTPPTPQLAPNAPAVRPRPPPRTPRRAR